MMDTHALWIATLTETLKASTVTNQIYVPEPMHFSYIAIDIPR